MKYNSLSGEYKEIDLQTAALQGSAPDGSLYMPVSIPYMGKDWVDTLATKPFYQVAAEALHPYLSEFFSLQEVTDIYKEAIHFPFELKEITDQIYTLELFHGPTLAFKDVGARFMSRVLQRFPAAKNTTILAATSGDTGSAVAHGFYKVQGIDVVLLYPKGKVSYSQEKQFTTLGENITALEIEGTFDDCQALVKQAFRDRELREQVHISSANSINILRLLPQMTYYLYVYHQLAAKGIPLHICVPSGNFGNITSAHIAQQMGIPFGDFIAATNANDVVPQYVKTGEYKTKPSVSTLSNAMDVGAPNNFPRIQSLYNNDWHALKKKLYSYDFSDQQTLDCIAKVYQDSGYILDPHGAVGYLAAEKHLKEVNDQGIVVFMETAHPAKFKETVDKALDTSIDVPPALANCMDKEKITQAMLPDYTTFSAFLKNRK